MRPCCTVSSVLNYNAESHIANRAFRSLAGQLKHTRGTHAQYSDELEDGGGDCVDVTVQRVLPLPLLRA